MSLRSKPGSSKSSLNFGNADRFSASAATRAASIGTHTPVEGDANLPISLNTPHSLYQKTTLENGIRVVTETIAGLRSVAIGILVDACPRDELPEKAGLAHLVEHLLFQGTSSRDENQIANLMDVGGGNFGGFTTRDYTCYFATVLDDYRTYAIDLLGDILLNSIFPPKNIEREKTIILREIDRVRDTPYEWVHMLLKSAVWPDHPLGRAITGDSTTVQELSREDVIYFVHNNYLPNRMIIAAAGVVNLLVGRHLIRVGRRTHSLTLEADGRHLLTDSLTSFGVVLGLLLVMATGWLALDPLVAMAVAANILVTGGRLVYRSVRGLMDAADPHRLQRIVDHLVKCVPSP